MKNNNYTGGNYCNKYNSKNPALRFAVGYFLNTLYSLMDDNTARVLDLGCGEGGVINFLTQKFPNIYIKGVDIDPHMLADLKKHYPQFNFINQKIDSPNFSEKDSFDAVVCLEVIEHIKNYHTALENIKKIHAKRIIISVPHEPLFCLSNMVRGAHLKNFGNTPGHINNFTYFGFKKLLKKHFPNYSIKIKPCIIWNFALLQKK